MSSTQKALVAINKTIALIDYNVFNNLHKQHEFLRQTLLADKSLTKNEKTEAIRILVETYDENKIRNNEGMRRVCENCNQECLATSYCEYCIRNYLKSKFSNWTSGNVIIDNLIQECQMNTLISYGVVEWIPYNKFENITYLTKGGFSEIYTADWIDGRYVKWDFKKQQLKRNYGFSQKVVLKRLENVENANQSWLEEVSSQKYLK
jgi:hypothetical protein